MTERFRALRLSAGHYSSPRATTGAAVRWSPAPWTIVGEAGPAQRSGNLATVLQEIVDQQDWSEDFDVGGRVLSFGADAAGELYVTVDDGAVYRVVPRR